jgi:Protein of unknown function (DUF3455)
MHNAPPASAHNQRIERHRENRMKNLERFTRCATLLIGVVALTSTAAVAAPPLFFGCHNDTVVPSVPANLQVPVGNKAYLEGHAMGTQDYICLPCPNAITTATACPASGFAWAFYGPQATLFSVDDGDDRQIMTHFLSPNPAEAGKPRPTWQDSRDTSTVWANNSSPPAQSSTDPAFVAAGAIPWLLLPMAGTQVGPTSGNRLTKTTFVQRLDTAGGVAPAAATCASAADAGIKALVPYSADYFFYKASK